MKGNAILTSKKIANDSIFLTALDTIIKPKIKNYDRTDVVDFLKIKKSRRNGTLGKVISIKSSPSKENQSKTSIKKVFSYTLLDTIESVRDGIDYDNFKLFYNLLNLTNKKWAEILGVSEKTMQNIIKERRFLEQKKSEKLLSFLLLVKYGIEVFGSQNSFEEWLVYKTPVLMNKAPIDYLDTVQGINLLHEQIFKIETGNLI